MKYSNKLAPLFCAVFVVLFVGSFLPAQEMLDKRPLDHTVYDQWNTIGSASLSNDGAWIMYSVRNGKGASTLFVRDAKSGKEYSVKNGVGGKFTDDSRFTIYRVSPDPELLKKLRKAKKPANEMPKPKLEMLELGTGRLTTIEGVSSFQLPKENSRWVAIQLSEKQDAKKKDGQSDEGEVFEVTSEGLQRPVKKSQSKGAAKTTGEGSKTKGPKSTKANAKNKNKKTGSESGKKAAVSTEQGSDSEKTQPKEKTAGNTLVLRDLETGQERRFPNVTSYQFSKPGNILVFATAVASGPKVKSDPDGDGVSVIDLKTGVLTQVLSGLGSYRNIAIDPKGGQVAFLSDRDDQVKQPSWSLYQWRARQKVAKRLAHEGDKGIPEGWWVANSAAPQFSEDGKRLYFNTAPKPEEESDEDDEPKAKLDLWHWQDPQLQPQQLLQAASERNRSYVAKVDLKSRKIVQLANRDIPSVRIDPKSDANLIVVNSNEKYRKLLSWDIPGYQDVYVINQKTGENTRVLERSRSGASQSPGGKFMMLWDTESQGWQAMRVDASKDQKPVEISEGIQFSLFNELHDTPSDPRPYGIAGWLDNDESVLVYDRYDIWRLDPTGEDDPVCLTEGVGRERKQRLRYMRLDPELRSIAPSSPMMLSVFDETTKGSGFFKFTPAGKGDDSTSKMERMLLLDESLGRLTKAKNADQVVFTRSTFRMCPDLWYSSVEFKKVRRISRINPQQRDFVWGTAELTKWESATGEELEGLIYKPEGFDPAKKYPLLVYFYERNSDNLHRYYAPAAGRSIINFSFYVSRGYVLFVPDIPYRTGYPGQSAADAVLPGVKHVVDQGYIDEAKIGMQGHSWGGYQTAFLVTQTDVFACAESGAPVSNMTSAYGGIRWGTGMSRMFQYEKTQSRIGATLWEDREKYILNSPVFHADKINTPLLILHNDEDGAVPWYQGIELFVALRRLEKPSWLMNYNEQPHWVMKEENRRDFARRMQQFFDHYLKDDPMPVWMATGIPAVDKGKKFGFEPADVKTEKVESATELEK